MILLYALKTHDVILTSGIKRVRCNRYCLRTCQGAIMVVCSRSSSTYEGKRRSSKLLHSCLFLPRLGDGGMHFDIKPVDGPLAKLKSVCLEDGDLRGRRETRKTSGHILFVVFRIFRLERTENDFVGLSRFVCLGTCYTIFGTK